MEPVKILGFYFLLCASVLATPKVLIVDGFSNHDWKRTTQALKSILDEHGIDDVTVATAPGIDDATFAEWAPNWDDYDVVIQTCNSLGGRGDWSEKAKTTFGKWVKAGGGVVMHHAANNSFAEWPEYNRMIGLGWRKKEFGKAVAVDERGQRMVFEKGEGENTGHGRRIDTKVMLVDEHALTKGVPKVWHAQDLEVYRYARGSAEDLTVLSVAMEPKTKLRFPVEWLVSYGEGEVYVSTFGHLWHDQKELPPGMKCKGAQAMLVRAVLYLAGVEEMPEWPEF